MLSKILRSFNSHPFFHFDFSVPSKSNKPGSILAMSELGEYTEQDSPKLPKGGKWSKTVGKHQKGRPYSPPNAKKKLSLGKDMQVMERELKGASPDPYIESKGMKPKCLS